MTHLAPRLPHYFIALMCVAASGLTAPTYAAKGDAADIEIPVDSRVRILTYSPNDIYLINTKYGYQTNITFGPSEEITTISVGDRSLWQIIPNGNRLFIRPMVDNIATNMTIVTNLREYTFDLKSIAMDKNDNIYSAQFRYPNVKTTQLFNPNDPIAPEVAPTLTARTPEVVSPTTDNIKIPPLDTQRLQNPNFNYTFSGTDLHIPEQVYDDGKYTYIVFRSMPTPAPQLFIINHNGEEVLAYQKIDQNMIVLNNVAPVWVMRSNTGAIKIHNELLTQP